MDINKIIDIIHTLKEDGMVTGAPTNSLTSPSDGKGYIAGTVEAGDDPPVRKKNKRNKNKYIYGTGFRKNWLQKKINNGEKIEDILFTKMDQLKDKMDKDHTAVLAKLQGLEKKVWIGIGVLAAVSFTINNSEMLANILTTTQNDGRMERLR